VVARRKLEQAEPAVPAARIKATRLSTLKSSTIRSNEFGCALAEINARQRAAIPFPRRVLAGVDSTRNQKPTNSKHMPINLKPLGDRVLVEPVEEKETKKGGIIIPDTAKEKPTEGIIRALGTGKVDDNGKKVPFEVKVGDRVLVSKYGGTEVKLDGKEYKILGTDDILAIVD
jgi:chaperonin GroES